MIEITSLKNPKVKNAVKLMNRRERDNQNRFLIEGKREIQRAHEKNFPLEALFFCVNLFSSPQDHELISLLEGKGLEMFSCTEAVFKKIAYRENPDGFLAVCEQVHQELDALEKLLKKKDLLLLVAESVEKPGNLGTLLRSCDAAAVDALILADKLADIYNPNVVRASVGTLFSVPIIELKGEEAIHTLKRNGIKVIAATPEQGVAYTECNFTKKAAIVVGSEHEGLSKLWKKNADACVFVPMHGLADSLNVSIAATLILYEALRQRKKSDD